MTKTRQNNFANLTLDTSIFCCSVIVQEATDCVTVSRQHCSTSEVHIKSSETTHCDSDSGVHTQIRQTMQTAASVTASQLSIHWPSSLMTRLKRAGHCERHRGGLLKVSAEKCGYQDIGKAWTQ